MRSARALSALALVAIACRIGGPTADPSAYVALPDDGGDEAATGGEDGGGNDADIGQNTAADSPSGTTPDAGLVAPDAHGDASGRDGGDGGACRPPASVAACNPVTNTGCTLLQCDVDTSASTPTAPAGVCVLGPATPTAENGACTQTSGSTPCQADLSCVGGVCKRVCFCDSDCMGAECCSGAYATTGFKLCGACQ